MPLYEFECKKCGFTFKHMMSIKDGEQFKNSNGNCPSCGAYKSTVKLISAGSFKINGYNEKNGYSKPGKRK
jgi:putative FmdB family regulatory protein